MNRLVVLILWLILMLMRKMEMQMGLKKDRKTMTRKLLRMDMCHASPCEMETDAEHPTNITMSRVRSARDTCDIYFTYIKVNHLLYTCSLDPFEDGILLDIPLV